MNKLMDKDEFLKELTKHGTVKNRCVCTDEVIDLRDFVNVVLDNMRFEAIGDFNPDCAVSNRESDNPSILVASGNECFIKHGRIKDAVLN